MAETDLSSLSGDDDNIEENNIPTSELDRVLNDFTHFNDDNGNEFLRICLMLIFLMITVCSI
jgi:hypothetical protein